MKQFMTTEKNEKNESNSKNKKESLGKTLSATIAEATANTTVLSDTISSAFSSYFPTSKSTKPAKPSPTSKVTTAELKTITESTSTVKTDVVSPTIKQTSETKTPPLAASHNTPITSNTKDIEDKILTAEQIELIAAPDLNQSKLIAEALKRKEANLSSRNRNSILFDKSNIKAFQERAKERLYVGMKTLSDAAETAKASTNVVKKQSFDEVNGVTSSTVVPVLEGIVWKRRDGLGKYSYTQWERRRFVLSGNSLIYYALENEIEQGETSQVTSDHSSAATSSISYTSAPRGTFYLLKDSFSIKATLGHHANAPTPFVITIVPRLLNTETKWKLCFETHKEMMKWNNALVNVVVSLSIYKFKEKEKQDWKMMSDDSSSSDESEVEEEVYRSRETPARSMTRTNSSRTRKQHLFQMLWILSNLVILYSCHCNSYLLYYLLVLLYNGAAITLHIVFSSKNNLLGKEISTSFRKTFLPKESSDPKLQRKKREKKLKELEKKKNKKSKTVPLIIGASTRKHDENNKDETKDKIEWNIIPSSLFQVRSHDYLTSKIKIPSQESLYSLFAVDVYETDRRVSNISSRFQLPTDIPKDNPDWNCPEILIFYLSLPTEAPSLGFSSSSDEDAGIGLILICYFRLNESSKKILRQIHGVPSASITDDAAPSTQLAETTTDPNQSRINAVKLFAEWVKRSPTDPSFQGRFKLIPISDNLDEVGVPSYMQKYKNKPLLIKRSGTTGIFTSISKEILEFEVNFYPFPYLGKQAFSYLRSHYLSKMDLSLAFVIEGRCAEELPEIVVGCINVSKQDLDLMPKLQI